MVCDDCQTKQTKQSNMDMWKEGSRNATVGAGKDSGRRLGSNKLLSGNRYGNLTGGKSNRFEPYGGGAQAKRCRLCKSMLHGDAELYCMQCGYKHGLCTMCGKSIADTSMYASGQVWDGTEDKIAGMIKQVDEDVRQEKRKKKNPGLAAAEEAAAAAAAEKKADADQIEAQEKIYATFGAEGGLGIVFTDEGWEIEEIVDGGAAAEMDNLHPGLCLIEIREYT